MFAPGWGGGINVASGAKRGARDGWTLLRPGGKPTLGPYQTAATSKLIAELSPDQSAAGCLHVADETRQVEECGALGGPKVAQVLK